MPLFYADSLRDDEDISKLLAALQIGDASPLPTPPPTAASSAAAVRNPGTVVSDDGDRNRTCINNANNSGSIPQQARSTASLAVSRRPPAQAPLPAHSSSATRPHPPVLQNDVYNVTSGKRTGVRETWPDAGDATQGVPGGHVVKVHVIVPRETRRRRTAYVVFEGLRPGIYNTWEEVEPLVKRVPGNIHQGFDTRLEAERAYVVAYALGAVRVLPSRDDAGSQLVSPAIPTPEAIMAAFSSASDNFLGVEWHVVFKGLRPGIYPAWNFAATQTKGIRCAIYQKYESKAKAEEAYADALRDRYVEVLENN